MAYKKGETGNKAGRKTGIPNKRNVMANALIKYSEDNDIDAKQAVLSRIIDDAINGDSVSQKLILERLEPAYKTVIKPIELSLGDGDLFDKAEAIIDSISKGIINIDDASTLLSSLTDILKMKDSISNEKFKSELFSID